MLTGVKLNLTNIKGKFFLSQINVDQFDHAINLLDNSIKELRRVAHNMMPEALIKFGLKDVMVKMAIEQKLI
jgi:two-component system, NarL family, sensor kinase